MKRSEKTALTFCGPPLKKYCSARQGGPWPKVLISQETEPGGSINYLSPETKILFKDSLYIAARPYLEKRSKVQSHAQLYTEFKT